MRPWSFLSMLRSPLLGVTVLGILAGAAVGLGAVLLSPIAPSDRFVITSADRSAIALERLDDGSQRIVVANRPPPPPRSDEDTNKQDQKLTIPASDWWPTFYPALEIGDVGWAMSTIEQIKDDQQRCLLISLLVAHCGTAWQKAKAELVSLTPPAKAKPGPYTSEDDVNRWFEQSQKSYEARKGQLPAQVKKLESDCLLVLKRGAELLDKASDSREKVTALTNLSLLQLRISGDQNEARRLTAMGRDCLQRIQSSEQEERDWEITRSRWAMVFGWVGTLGIGGFAIAAFGQVFSYYLVRYIARLVGDDELAKHLGATIRTVKRTSLILPDEYSAKRECVADQGSASV